MATAQGSTLELLYETDETAWLETMSRLAAQGRLGEMDYANLGEYLSDMANRDRREVFSRLVVLITHLLKAEHQPLLAGRSWQATIREQRRELRQLLESGTLRIHASNVLDEAFAESRRQAADETGFPVTVFPAARPWELDDILGDPSDGHAPSPG